MADKKEEYTTTVHYIGQEFSPPEPDYTFVSSQIVSHDDFKQETYVYVVWKKVGYEDSAQQSFWDSPKEGE